MQVSAAGWSRPPFEKRNGPAGSESEESFSVLAEVGLAQTGMPQSGALSGEWTPAQAVSPSMKLSAALVGSSIQSESPSTAKTQSAAEEFLTLSDMTPEERIRAEYLEDNDLTEESLEAMKPEEREAIESEIAERIERELGVENAGDKQEKDYDTEA